MTYWIAVLTHTHKHTYINIHERSLISCLTLFDHFCVSLLEWCKICHCFNMLYYWQTLHDWPWWVTTCHPSSIVSPALTSSGVSSSLPKSIRAIVLNISVVVALLCSARCSGVTMLFSCCGQEKKIKKNKISLLPDLIQHSPWSPPLLFGSGWCHEIPYYF